VNGTADVGLRALYREDRAVESTTPAIFMFFSDSVMGAVESVTRLRVAAFCREVTDEVAWGVGRWGGVDGVDALWSMDDRPQGSVDHKASKQTLPFFFYLDEG
jgi:hypothetical protein